MSKNLLYVRSGTGLFPIYYKNFVPTGYSPISTIIAERNRLLYIFMMNSSLSEQNRVYDVYQLNMFTGDVEKAYSLAKSRISSKSSENIGGVLLDDTYMYVCINTGTVRIKVFLLVTMEHIKTYQYDTSTPVHAGGKLAWYDDKTIVLVCEKGVLLFDIEERTYTLIPLPNDETVAPWQDFAVGKRKILLSFGDTPPKLAICDLESQEENKYTFETVRVDNTGDGAVTCYHKGKFYIASSDFLHIYDELTGEIVTSEKSAPWKDPYALCYANGGLFGFSSRSLNRTLYIFNIREQSHWNIYLPWQINGKPLAVDGYVFLQQQTLGIFNYSGYAKYNFGQRYQTDTVQFNETYESDFEYDPRFITFSGTYMSMHDGYIDHELTPTENTGIKSTTVRKSEYKFMRGCDFK